MTKGRTSAWSKNDRQLARLFTPILKIEFSSCLVAVGRMTLVLIITKAVNTFADSPMPKSSSGQDVYFSVKFTRQGDSANETYDPLEETVNGLPISLVSMTLLSAIKDRVSTTP